MAHAPPLLPSAAEVAAHGRNAPAPPQPEEGGFPTQRRTLHVRRWRCEVCGAKSGEQGGQFLRPVSPSGEATWGHAARYPPPMRLVRVQHGGQPHWGQLEGETVHLTRGMGGERTGESVLLAGAALLAPAEPTKIVCVGRNYLDHIRELGNDTGDLPKEPGIFLKGPNALAEPGGTVTYPEWTGNFHFEGELALVVGRQSRNLTAENALEAVAGYTCGLDLTARDLQKTDLQWFRAKAADRFCPLGPWLETEFDPRDVRVQTRVNGETRQDGRTVQMIFPVVDILVYLTRFVTLEPGDVVLTGTPEGVGALQRGDLVEVEVEGIGVLTTHIGE